MDIGQAIFRRTELLLGEERMARLGGKRVIIFGVGGVGSWCAESLVRSGIGQLTIVDPDRVCITNINRQLMATTKTVGQVKVEALRERLLAINPAARITALQQVFTAETADSFALEDYDYIVDAIDSLQDKQLLIVLATSLAAKAGGDGAPKLFSSMGAALKMDPTRIRVTEFWKVQGDPLARALRKRFKQTGLFPKRKFLCVYSDELLQNMGRSGSCGTAQCVCAKADGGLAPKKAQANGTLVHATAMFGFMLAGLVVKDAVG